MRRAVKEKTGAKKRVNKTKITIEGESKDPSYHVTLNVTQRVGIRDPL